MKINARNIFIALMLLCIKASAAYIDYKAGPGILKQGSYMSADTTMLMTASRASDSITTLKAMVNGKVSLAQTISINGVSQSLSSNRSWTIDGTETKLNAGSGVSISGSGSAGSPYSISATPISPTFNNSASHSLNSAFQISATKNVRVYYTLSLSTALSLVNLNSSASVTLQISANGSTEWVNINSASISKALTIGLVAKDTILTNVSGEVPAGYYAKITTSTAGGGAASYSIGQEISY